MSEAQFWNSGMQLVEMWRNWKEVCPPFHKAGNWFNPLKLNGRRHMRTLGKYCSLQLQYIVKNHHAGWL